jgi:hypothetical protein
MNPRVKVLKQLVDDGHYVIGESAVVEAMLVRSMALRMLPDVTFHSKPCRTPQVRSFRPHRGARSFRLSRTERRPLHVRSGAELEPVA